MQTQIIGIEVERLFNLFTYHLDFSKQISIIIGPNGVGKTTLLRMVTDAMNGHSSHGVSPLFDSPYFASFSVFIRVPDIDYPIRVVYRAKSSGNNEVGASSKSTTVLPTMGLSSVSVSFVNSEKKTRPYIEKYQAPHPLSYYLNLFLYREGYRRDMHILSRQGCTFISASRLMNDYSIETEQQIFDFLLSRTSLSKEAISSLSSTFRSQNQVLPFSRELANLVNEKVSILAGVAVGRGIFSTSIFPRMYFSFLIKGETTLRPNDIADLAAELYENGFVKSEQYFRFLSSLREVSKSNPYMCPTRDGTVFDSFALMPETQKRYGNIGERRNFYSYDLPVQAISDGDLKESERRLSYFYSDMEKKDSLASKKSWALYDLINLYKNFVLLKNIFEKQLNNVVPYTMAFSSESGISLRRDDGQIVPINVLSSGQISMLVVFYTVLFNLDGSSVFAIDEPENSLHLLWQRKYVDILEAIIQKRECQVILATQSPFIMNDHSDYVTGVEINGGQKCF